MTQTDKLQHDMMQQLSTAFMEIPFNRMLGLHLEQLDNHAATMTFRMKHELIGNFLQGILHGGVISSVLDMAGGIAVMATVVHKHAHQSQADIVHALAKCSTIDLQISYLRPGKGEVFTAKAWIVKSGSKVSFTRMELYNEQEILLAMATGTYAHT